MTTVAVIRYTLSILAAAALLGLMAVAGGCAGRASLIPNHDPALRHTATEFAADAAARFPYKADAPRGGQAVGAAEVGYTLNMIRLVNLSDETWHDTEVWVNQSYVVFVPEMKKGDLKNLNFQMIYNQHGEYFPVDNNTPATRVNKVEIYRDGKMYDVTVRLAD